MKLHEIVNRPYTGNPADLDQLAANPNRKEEATIEGHQVWFTDALDTVKCYDIDGVAAVTGLQFSSNAIPKGFRISTLLVKPEARGKGLATALYKYLLDLKGYTLVSDTHMSDGAIAVWKGLIKLGYEVTVLKDGQLHTIVTPDDIQDAVDGNPNTLLLAKNKLVEYGIPCVGEGILSPRKIVTEGNLFH